MKPTLYGEVADRVLSLIESGTFRAGDKLPSIRTLSGRFSVSVNTVKEAYGLLETQRFLEARPQSGYYVRRAVPPLPKPAGELASRPALDPRDVGMCRVYGEVTRDGRNLSGASLAIALPDPDLLPSAKLNAAFQTSWKTMGRSMTDYALSPGLPLLREQIAQEALQAGVALSPDEIIITSGTSEALTLALLALCRTGDTLAVEAPTYFNFLSLIRELGIKVLEIPTTPDEGVNLDILAWAFETHAVKAFVTIATFNNPLGYRMTDERKKALVELCRTKGVPLIEDDIYGDLPFVGPRPRTCQSFDTDGNVLLVSGFSKTLASGYRIGWTVPGRWYARIDKLKSLTSVATATPTQWAVGRFLETGGYQRHLRGMRQRLADQVGAMAETVARCFPRRDAGQPARGRFCSLGRASGKPGHHGSLRKGLGRGDCVQSRRNFFGVGKIPQRPQAERRCLEFGNSPGRRSAGAVGGRSRLIDAALFSYVGGDERHARSQQPSLGRFRCPFWFPADASPDAGHHGGSFSSGLHRHGRLVGGGRLADRNSTLAGGGRLSVLARFVVADLPCRDPKGKGRTPPNALLRVGPLSGGQSQGLGDGDQRRDPICSPKPSFGGRRRGFGAGLCGRQFTVRGALGRHRRPFAALPGPRTGRLGLQCDYGNPDGGNGDLATCR